MLAKTGEHFGDFLAQIVVPVDQLAAHALRDYDLIGGIVVASPMKVVLEDEGNQLLFGFGVFGFRA